MSSTKGIRILIFSLLILLSQSCSSSNKQQAKSPDATTPPPPSPEGYVTIPPNHCRIVGTVMDIDPARDTAAQGMPCSVEPCNAAVRIDSVIAYGQSFPTALSRGETITVKFIYTTRPTERVFPEMKPSLPGLGVGSRFAADLSGNGEPMQGQKGGMSFEIGAYVVR